MKLKVKKDTTLITAFGGDIHLKKGDEFEETTNHETPNTDENGCVIPSENVWVFTKGGTKIEVSRSIFE